MTRLLSIAGLLALLVACEVHIIAQAPKQPGAGFKGVKPPSGNAAQEFPKALTPAAALASIKVPAGLRVELVAAEPLVMDPVDIAWGADGKLWVVEMADYPLGLDGKGQPGGRVRYLQDTDGDGKYDKSTLFLDGIAFPTGVMPWRQGVLIAAAPAVFYAEDTDGDGKADVQKPLLTGFGEGNQQHRVNGLRWGLDGWLYLANGDSDGQIRSAQTGQVVDIRGRDLRFRPDDGQLDPQTGRAQYGRNRDDWGNWFGCNNSNPMWHYVLADHYLRRNPHLLIGKGGATAAVPRQPGAAPVFPTSKTLARFNDADKSNRFTSACGVMIYRDDWLGAAFAGNAFVCEPVHNLVHREIVEPRGVTFRSQRAADEQTSEFLTSTDNWFRPVAAHTGPDGALYIVDMYRLVIEHPQWIPLEWQAQLDLRAGHDRGRIYRIVPTDAAPRRLPRLDQLDTAGLVAALESPNGWQRDTVQQMLTDRAAVPLLRALVKTSRQPLARLHALCTLAGLDAIEAADLRRALADEHPGVRRHAIRLSEPMLADLGPALLPLAADADPQVQLQLAYSLGGWRDPRAGAALAKLAVKHQADAYLPAAVFSSMTADNAGGMLTAVLADAQADGGTRERLLRLAAALGDEKVLSQALAAASQTTAGRYQGWQFTALAAILEIKPALRDQAAAPFAAARILAVADGPEADRCSAIRLLASSRTAQDIEVLTGLLTPRQTPAVQDAALAALGMLPLDAVPNKLLADLSAFSPRLRAQAVAILLSREAWTRQLLNHLEQGKVAASLIDSSTRQRLLQHRNEAVRQQAGRLLAGASNADRKKVVAQFQTVLTMKGDLENGKLVFRQRCATCHQVEGFGHALGPDLTALKDRSAPFMLTAILDPNQAVEDRFLDYVAVTTDGRILTGLLGSETGAAITLKAAEGKEQEILRSQLDDLRSTGKSMMPEGMEKDLTAQQMADVIHYLSAAKSAGVSQ